MTLDTRLCITAASNSSNNLSPFSAELDGLR